MNSAGPRIERSTCVSAAKLTIASQPCGRPRDRVGVGDVALMELVLDALEVRAVAGVGQLVEHDDLVAGRRETANELRADEPGAAGDEHAHRATGYRPVAVENGSWTHACESSSLRVAIFTWEWTAAPRVHASPAVLRQLPAVHGDLVPRPVPSKACRSAPCGRFSTATACPASRTSSRARWVQVDHGRVTGRDPVQVQRAVRKLRRVA